MRILTTLLFFVYCVKIFAQDAPISEPSIVYDRSDDEVPLNITFDGQDILIYGALKNVESDDPDVVVSVIGPSRNYTIYRQVSRYGLWVNGPSLTFRNAPSFVALSSNEPLDDIILPTEKQRHRIGLDQMLRLRGLGLDVEDAPSYARALTRKMSENGNFVVNPSGVKISGGVLFSAQIPLASDLIEGEYDVNIYLLEEGKVKAAVQSKLPVHKTGIERWIYDLSKKSGFLYGLMAIALAVFVAFASAQIMRLFQR